MEWEIALLYIWTESGLHTLQGEPIMYCIFGESLLERFVKMSHDNWLWSYPSHEDHSTNTNQNNGILQIGNVSYKNFKYSKH